MKFLLTQAKTWLIKHALAFECLLIFCTTLFVYLANNQLISSNDSVPNSLLAFNWLENHTFYLDAFRGGHYYMPNDVFGENGIPYFFVEAPNGHLTSAYPIGAAVISLPLYLLFFIHLKLTTLFQSGFTDAAVSIAAPAFEHTRQIYEKLAGAALAALTAVIFYLAVQLKFNRPVAIITTFIYAFATLNWVVSAQGLWTHTISNLALVSIMLCFLKANRVEGRRKKILLVTAGFFCGLLAGIRPTCLLFMVAVFVYALVTYRKQALFFVIGCASALFNIAWNIHFFGFSLRSLVAGGYSSLFKTSSSYLVTPEYFKEAFWGLLVSPSRGILIFSPILLFAIPGIYQLIKRRSQPDERLFGYLFIACLILFFQYCVYVPWWGAITYGSRFLVDALPVVCFLIGYFLDNQISRWQQRKRLLTPVFSLFLVFLLFSTFTEAVGAFSDPHIWDTAPGFNQARFWDWQDNQIGRHTKNLLLKLDPPIPNKQVYRRSLRGKIIEIQDGAGQPLETSMTALASREIPLQAQLKNIGKSQWFGYDTGLKVGRTTVKVKFLDAAGREVDVVSPNLLYVTGAPKKGEKAVAKGNIWFPQMPGEYQMVFELALEQMGNFPKASTGSVYTLKALVQDPANLPPQ